MVNHVYIVHLLFMMIEEVFCALFWLITNLTALFKLINPDLPMLLKALHGCMELRQVSLEGNPVAQEPQLLSHLISVLPHMDSMDDLPLYHPLPEKVQLYTRLISV